MTDSWLAHRSVLIVTHTYTTGPSLELRDYLLPRTRIVAYMSHPFSYADDTRSTMTVYENGREVYRSVAPPLRGPELVFYAKDVLLTTLYALTGRRQFDLAVASDPLNAASLAPWRGIGLVKRLVYYAIDYTPKRFSNVLLNASYHAIERLACYHSDCIWNTSGRMVEARYQNGVSSTRCAPQMTVPTGSHVERIVRRPVSDINRYAVAFLGHLVPKGGVELLVRSFPHVVAAVPQAHLNIIGGGPLLDQLKQTANELGIAGQVTFHGHVRDHLDVEGILSCCAVAAAPYVPDETSVSAFGGVNKPLVYLGAGLPVVITDVPEIAQTIAVAGAGEIVEYTEESLARSLVRLLSDDAWYLDARRAAVAVGARYSWQAIFDQALARTLRHVA